ncbi:MAG: 16S rRNA (adenine(1518)-N(6)/adenine(1519)-N(6))-dimethyltransferase RsmA [Parvularculaceae bacterium]
MTAGLPPLREVIARHDLGADKAFGQHFLLDLNITRKIARVAAAGPGDVVIEVGPGPGGLTRALLETGAAVIAIERDRRFTPALDDLKAAFPGALTIVEADALAVDERALLNGATAKIVANLPYNISTELLVKWLAANHEAAPLWSQMTLMFQKEVADRILAAPGSKTYGRLSVIAQAASRPSRAFDLPARAFTPPPKVQSSVVAFAPAPARVETLARLEKVTQAAFSQRRKMLRSSLKPVFGAEVEARLAAAGVAATRRAEEIAVADFLTLAGLSD